MTWHPPLTPTSTTVLVLVTLGVIALSFLWSRRDLNPLSPAGLLALGLRGGGFLLLLFFFLQPSRLPAAEKKSFHRTLAVLIDTSGSMSLPANNVPGAPSRLDAVRKLLADHNVLAAVSAQADVALYGFDSQPTPIKVEALPELLANGKSTDLGAAMAQTAKLHQNDDLAGLLMLTDGRDNAGADPRDIAGKLKIPIYPLAVGEEPSAATRPAAVVRDLAVEAVTADPRVILGRAAQVVATVSARGYDARQVTVDLVENGQVIATSAVAVSPQQTRRPALFAVRPTSVGTHTYQVRIPVEPDEVNKSNNTAGFQVDVIDPVNRLVYFDRLRPERRFLKPLLAAQPNIRYTAVVRQDRQRVIIDGNDAQTRQDVGDLSPQQFRGIKAVIVGDLPAAAFTPEQTAALADWVNQGGALLLMAGPESLGTKGFGTTALAKVLPMTLDAAGPAPPYVEKEFHVDLTPEGAAHPAFQKIKKSWVRAAPLLSRFNIAGLRPGATVLMASADEDRAPVVVSQPYGHGKVAVVLTDSTWRWQLGFDPARGGGAWGAPSGGGGGGDETGNGTAAQNSDYAVFWRQMIDWLLPDASATPKGAGQVQLIADRAQYDLNDQVLLLASVRGADGAPITSAEVRFTITGPDGRATLRDGQFEPGAGGGAYTARFDAAELGDYNVQVTAREGDRPVGSDQVQVKVAQPLVEFTRTDPDRPLLEDLARVSGGRYLQPGDLDDLVHLAHLEPREVWVQPNAAIDAKSAWDRGWLLAAFVVLMTAEWFVRRRNQWI